MKNLKKIFGTSAFARALGVSIKTLRHYEKVGLLVASEKSEAGHRRYSLEDYFKMQSIYVLKSVGLSLHEILNVLNKTTDLKEILKMQKDYITQRTQHDQFVLKAIQETEKVLENESEAGWDVLNRIIKTMDMGKYYGRRAKEYEEIYHRNDPIRQCELGLIKDEMKEVFQGKRILEVACGTGYWTEAITQVAKQITAFDISEETLIEARKKTYHSIPVSFIIGDAFQLDQILGDFDAGYAMFWFSHIPKARIGLFLKGFHEKLGKGAVVFMADNRYMAGIGGELISKIGEEDTYKMRQLANGEQYEVLKNYYSEEELMNLFKNDADDIQIRMGECFWRMCYKVK